MAAKKKNEEEIKEPAAKEPEQEDDGAVEVDVAPEGGDDDEGDDGPDDGDDARPPRQQRRSNRFREFKEKAETAHQESLRLKAERDQAMSMLNQLQQGQQVQQFEQQAQAEIGKIQREWEDIHVAYRAERDAGTLTPEKEAQYIERARDIDERKTVAVMRKHGMGGQGLNPHQVRALAQREMLMSRYGDVLQNQQTMRYALGVLETRRANGEQDSEALYDEIAEETRRRFGLQSQVRRPPPSVAQKQRFSGVSAGANGMRTNGNGNGSTMRLTKDDQKMALEMFPKGKDGRRLKPQESFRLYAANLAQQRSKRGEKIA